MKKHIIENLVGSLITSAIDEAIKESAARKMMVQFDFNGVTVKVYDDSDPKLILRDWERGMMRPSDTFTVYPYPSEILTDEQIADDRRLTEESETRSRISREEYEQKMVAKKAQFEKETLNQTIQFADAAIWQSWVDANSDGYGAAIMQYAENWARLMQAKMSQGEHLEAIAKQTSFDADTEGITGFMYGAAVSMLSKAWIYGEQLRRWHNLETQIGNEGEKANETGGTLNPVLLNIGAA